MTIDVEPRPLGPDEQLLFLHIAKTAGTSLIRLLDQHFIEDELCPVDWPTRYLLREIKPEEIQRARFVRGHFEYNYVIKMFARPPRIMTMLRDPVERFVSEFEHIRRLVTGRERPPNTSFPPEVLDRDRILQERFKDVTEGRINKLEEFIERPDLTHWLTGSYIRVLGWKKKPSLAFKRITEMEFVGIAEDFSRSVELLCYLLGLPAPGKVWHLNAAPQARKRGGRWDLPPGVRRRIEEIVAGDLELYHVARDRFERDYALMKQSQQKRSFLPPHWIWPGGPKRKDFKYREIYFNFQRVPVGHGWLVGKRDPDLGILRFPQDGKPSRLFFALPPQRWRLQIGVWSPHEPWDVQLTINFNGHQTTNTLQPQGHQGLYVVDAEIAPEWIQTETWNELVLSWQMQKPSRWQQRVQKWLGKVKKLAPLRLSGEAGKDHFTKPSITTKFTEFAFRWIKFSPAENWTFDNV